MNRVWQYIVIVQSLNEKLLSVTDVQNVAHFFLANGRDVTLLIRVGNILKSKY